MLVLLTVIVLAGGGPAGVPHHKPSFFENAPITVSKNGKTVASSHTGRLKVRLRPGRYLVSSKAGPCEHKLVNLKPKHPIEVKLICSVP